MNSHTTTTARKTERRRLLQLRSVLLVRIGRRRRNGPLASVAEDMLHETEQKLAALDREMYSLFNPKGR